MFATTFAFLAATWVKTFLFLATILTRHFIKAFHNAAKQDFYVTFFSIENRKKLGVSYVILGAYMLSFFLTIAALYAI